MFIAFLAAIEQAVSLLGSGQAVMQVEGSEVVVYGPGPVELWRGDSAVLAAALAARLLVSGG